MAPFSNSFTLFRRDDLVGHVLFPDAPLHQRHQALDPDVHSILGGPLLQHPPRPHLQGFQLQRLLLHFAVIDVVPLHAAGVVLLGDRNSLYGLRSFCRPAKVLSHHLQIANQSISKCRIGEETDRLRLCLCLSAFLGSGPEGDDVL